MKFSIITINLNDVAGLKNTTQSVFNQKFNDFEYLIIDGGSTDGSKQYIQTHSDQFSYWISEKDTGIYNAMNKGILKAQGEFLFFLNSGDYLINPDVLTKVNQAIQSKKADIYYGNLKMRQINGQEYLTVYPKQLSLYFFANNSCPHPATFINRELFNSMNAYREDFQIVSDWIFFLEAWLNGTKFSHLPFPVTSFGLDGISSINSDLHELERSRAIANIFQSHASVLKYLKYYHYFIKSAVNTKLQFLSKYFQKAVKILKHRIKTYS